MDLEIEKLIITDLTRFNNNREVCTAGIDMNTGRCIRPMPYLSVADCEKLNIEPGAILKGKFSTIRSLTGPHQEDMNHTGLQFVGPCDTSSFKQALEHGLVNNVEEGFGLPLPNGHRCIPHTHHLDRSIISISVDPRTISLTEDDRFPPQKKLKLRFTDSSGNTFRNAPIADRGFHENAKKCQEEGNIEKINNLINSQEVAILRIGLARRWAQPGTTKGVNYVCKSTHTISN